MRISLSNLVAAFVSAALLAACGGSSSPAPPISAPQIGPPLRQYSAGLATEQKPVRPGYKVLYYFKGGKDGAGPVAGLLRVNGMLYGTTIDGGGKGCYKHEGCGTVFSITTSGKEAVLHSFGGSEDGASPEAGLINVNGTLYGTTYAGGGTGCNGYGCGTVFSITTSGKETVLHIFGGSGDGTGPGAGLINVNGTLYGTTAGGGTNCSGSGGCGTVFAITSSGKETVLYRFAGGSGDGYYPNGLVDLNGTLYGTTQNGGAYGASGVSGIVFAITTSGKETVLHSFAGGSGDGALPDAGLIHVNGTLYGTTVAGGPSSCERGYGCGTVFSIATSGSESLLYGFAGSPDGNGPEAGLLSVKGMLYGTTIRGGAKKAGTVFSVTTSGKEAMLHSFAGKPDGAGPEAVLINVNGTLYGTTCCGGANGYGTVFSLSP